jgi:hypothetical protein
MMRPLVALGMTDFAGHAKSYIIYKDAILEEVSKFANVAQFVSFSPGLQQRFAWIRGYPPNYSFASPEQAIRALIQSSPEASVNFRSFNPVSPGASNFYYKLENVEEAMVKLHNLATPGFFTIVNETIDVYDGGVSGVAYGGIIEFAPGDTPRCVEKPGTLSLPIDLGTRLIEKVYRFRPSIEFPGNLRVEFSIHPIRRGFRNEHTTIWEIENFGEIKLSAEIIWPNRFSQLIGDKTFGLLVADLLDLPVPATTVIPRSIPPFQFGRSTSTGETWIRTCPTEQIPGLFTTRHGWCDPFRLLAKEDPDGIYLASVLAQEGVEPIYSGAVGVGSDGTLIIEGVRGPGDKFMQGRIPPHTLPKKVTNAVQRISDQATAALGPVRLEWVFDGQIAWVVQLHRGATTVSGRTIFPGDANLFHRFDVKRGIDELRDLIVKVERTGDGIILVGKVGVTSHLGDLLRRARIPSRVEPT